MAGNTTWFTELTGVEEQLHRGANHSRAQASLRVEGAQLVSAVNGREFTVGNLEIPSLGELRQRTPETPVGHLQIQELVGDARTLHANSEPNSLFQVASQANLLEMINPTNTPEMGVGVYEKDATQGPQCAIAAGAGTIYRNYFVPMPDGSIGQTRDNQIDCFAEFSEALQALADKRRPLWDMKNGYALPTKSGLKSVKGLLDTLAETDLDELKKLLRIGIQWDTEVTITDEKKLVTQAYCSALPLAYSKFSRGENKDSWQSVAQLVLDASYEATFLTGLINYAASGNNTIYLTLIGGGVFGNDPSWITTAIERSAQKFYNTPLEVNIVSYQTSNPDVADLTNRLGM